MKLLMLNVLFGFEVFKVELASSPRKMFVMLSQSTGPKALCFPTSFIFIVSRECLGEEGAILKLKRGKSRKKKNFRTKTTSKCSRETFRQRKKRGKKNFLGGSKLI
jgi:hypothetical protein